MQVATRPALLANPVWEPAGDLHICFFFPLENGPCPYSKGMEEFPWLVPLFLQLPAAASQHSGMLRDVCCHLRPIINNAKAGRELGSSCRLDFPQCYICIGVLLSHGGQGWPWGWVERDAVWRRVHSNPFPPQQSCAKLLSWIPQVTRVLPGTVSEPTSNSN